MLRYLCFLAVILGVRSASAPFIKPCKTDDSACLVAAAQAAIPVVAPGVPDLGIASLDPMYIDIVKSNEAGVHLTLKNTTVNGMKNCQVKKIKLDLKKYKLQVSLQCSVVLKGSYVLGGQILFLPIEGNGPHTITIRDILIETNTTLANVQGEDGEAHWHINKWRHKYDVKTIAKFDFKNLFNGNEALAKPIELFLNDQWQTVMTEIAGPIVRAIVSRVVDAVESLFKAVPANQLYLE